MKLLQFLLDCTIIWSALYLVYHFLLRKETFFWMNRIFLLCGIMLGLLLPFIRYISFDFFTDHSPRIIYPISNAIYLAPAGHISEMESQSLERLPFLFLWLIYVIGFCIFANRMASGLYKIYNLYQAGDKTETNGFILVRTNQHHLPFSFFRYIFWSTKFDLGELDHHKILSHEMIHIDQRHSLDILLLELLGIIFWWHPLIYIYKKAIRQNHEFICDEAVGKKSAHYQSILSNTFNYDLQIALTHQFFQNHLKNRIMMLNKNSSAKYLRYKILAFIPVILLIIAILAFKSTTEIDLAFPVLQECVDGKNSLIEQQDCSEKKILDLIYKSIVYPKQARQKNKEGMAILGVTFDKSGLKDYQILLDDEGLFTESFTPVVESLKALKFHLSRSKQISFSVPVRFNIENAEARKAVRQESAFDAKKYPNIFTQDFLQVTGYGLLEKDDLKNEHILVVDDGLDEQIDDSSVLDSEHESQVQENSQKRTQIFLDHDHVKARILEGDEKGYTTFDSAIIKTNELEINNATFFKGRDLESELDSNKEKILGIFFKIQTADTTEVEAYYDTGSEFGKPIVKCYDSKMSVIENYQQFMDSDGRFQPEFVDHFCAIQGSSAIEKYGKEAAGGVLEIYLKDLPAQLPEQVKYQTPPKHNEIDALQVYPNPASDKLNISFSTKGKNLNITYYITDLQGKILLEKKELQLNGQWDLTMDIHTLPDGQYYFILHDGITRYQKPIQVNR